MTDDLIAYLLNDLTDERRAEVERQLAVDPKWRKELERLEECLEEGNTPDDCGEAAEESQIKEGPPGDLVTRTCTLVDSVCDSVSGLSQTTERGSGRSRWTLSDLSVAVGVCLILAALVLPAIRDSRDDSRRLACQNNLRTLGTALYDYAQAHDGRLPMIRANENAGMFAVKLASAGYLPPQELAQSLVCPESKLASESTNRRVLVRVLSSRDMHGEVKLKVQLWPIIGGSYAYRLGHFDKYGQYQQVPFTGSHEAPMLSDAPSFTLANFRSENHGGSGYNMMAQDLSCKYVVECDTACRSKNYDHPFLNSDLTHAAGRSPHDVVMGRSECTALGPLAPVSQSVAARVSPVSMMLYVSGMNGETRQQLRAGE